MLDSHSPWAGSVESIHRRSIRLLFLESASNPITNALETEQSRSQNLKNGMARDNHHDVHILVPTLYLQPGREKANTSVRT